MPDIVVDLRGTNLSEDILETAVLHAAEHEKHLFIIDSSQEQVMNLLNPGLLKISYCINSGLKTGVIVLLYCLSHSISQASILSFVDEVEIINIQNFSLMNINNISSVSELIRTVTAKEKEFVELMDDENVINTFSLYLNTIMSLSLAELEFLMGSSNLNEVQLNMRVNDNTGNILELKELTSLKQKYEKINSDNNNKLTNYKTYKVDSLNQFINQNTDQLGSLISINSYPAVYKYLSSFMYTCAEENYYNSNLSIAYLLYFRAFETYCEGALIAKNYAKVANYRNQGMTYQLLQNASYIKPMGFATKWNVLVGTNVFQQCSPQALSLLEKHKKLRNIMLYTHGEFIVNSTLLIEFRDVVTSMIKQMDINLVQGNFPWEVITKEMSSTFIYDPFSYVAKIVIDEQGLATSYLELS